MNPAPIDKRLRGALCADCRVLLAAYEEATGRVVMVDYQRTHYLFALVQRDITADDIRLVVRYVKRLIRTGENRRKIGTFTPASLEFVNLVGDTAKFCDRLQTAREELAAKRIVKGRMVPVTVKVSETDSITRLDSVKPERAPAPMREAIAESLLALVREIQR